MGKNLNSATVLLRNNGNKQTVITFVFATAIRSSFSHNRTNKETVDLTPPPPLSSPSSCGDTDDVIWEHLYHKPLVLRFFLSKPHQNPCPELFFVPYTATDSYKTSLITRADCNNNRYTFIFSFPTKNNRYTFYFSFNY